MKQLYFLFLILITGMISGNLYAQELPPAVNLVAAEYFIDIDPGAGNGTAIPLDMESDVVSVSNVEISLDDLSAGFHTIYVRFKDDSGQWGIPALTRLYNPETKNTAQISGAEVFFDAKKGFGTGVSIPIESGNEITTQFEIDLVNQQLQPGLHTAYFRLMDADGEWGNYAKRAFYVPEKKVVAQISGAEVFFDAKKGFGSGVSIPLESGNEIATQFEIDVDDNQLQSGLHTAYFRLMDTNGVWGNYAKRAFYIPEIKNTAIIDEAEYFYDYLGVPGTGTTLSASSSSQGIATIYNEQIDAPEQPGFHQLYLRFKDSDGVYGLPSKVRTYLPEVKRTSDLSELEYFIGATRPDFGSGSIISIEPGKKAIQESVEISINEFETGFNMFYVRLKDADNVWGNYSKQLIYVPKSKELIAKITDMEYFLSGSTRPSEGSGTSLEALTSSGTFDSTFVNAQALVTLTQTVGDHAVYVRSKDNSGLWGIPYPVSITIANQRDMQGQVYDENNQRIDFGSVELYKGEDFVRSAALYASQYGLFTFQNLDAGTYNARWKKDEESFKLGFEVDALGFTGPKIVDASQPQLITADIHILKPLHVVSTKPNTYNNFIKRTASIEVNFSGKFVPSSLTTNNVHFISDLRGALSIQITKQSNDSVLVIKPVKSLLANEKVSLYIDENYRAADGRKVTPFTTHYRAEVSGGGTDTFEGHSISTGSNNVTGLVIGDWDGDAKPDAALISYSSNPGIIIYKNDGMGNFTLKNTIAASINSYSSALIVGDYDKDGDLDLGLYHIFYRNGKYVGDLTLFKNDGTGNFTQQETLTIENINTGLGNYAIRFNDLNYDGYPEIIILSGNNSGVFILHNQKGTFSTNTQLDGNMSVLLPNSINDNLVVGDLTGDGRTDLLMSYSNSWAQFYVGQDSLIQTTLANHRTFQLNTTIQSYRYLVENFDNDSKLDLVNFTYSGIQFFRQGAKNDSYLNIQSMDPHTLRYTSRDNFSVGDLDGDGRLDVISIPDNMNTVNIFSLMQDVFSYKGYALSKNNVMRNPKLVDLDEDGTLDILYLELLNGTSIYNLTAQINRSTPSNSKPTVANKIDDLDIRMNQDSTSVNITDTFYDADGDNLALTIHSSNENVVTANIFGKQLSLYPKSIGNATITVTADDERGGDVSTTFLVYVNASDNLTPRVQSPITDLEIRIGEDSTRIDLTTIFTDPDAGDVLTFSTTNPNPSVADISLYDSKYLIIKPVSIGNVYVKVTASDGKANADNEFTVTIIEMANRAPVVTSTIQDVFMNLGEGSLTITPDQYFNDPDDDVLTYSVSSSDASIANGSFNESTRMISIAASKAGWTTLTITAIDPEEETVSANFIVYVNTKPAIIASIPTQTMVLGGSTASFALNSIFQDNDGGDALTYSVSGVDNSVIAVNINTNSGMLNITALKEGTSPVEITASDGKSNSEKLAFSVEVVNRQFTSMRSDSRESAYADGINVKEWILFSIPGYVSKNSPQLLFEDVIPKNDFRVFELLNSGDYADVTNAEVGLFSTGKAYWFKTLGLNQKFLLDAGAGQRENTRKKTLNISGTWNFIANPFSSEAAFYAPLSGTWKLWKYNPSSQTWTQLSSNEKLKPWTGYLLYTSTNQTITISLDWVNSSVAKEVKKEIFEETSISTKIQIGEQTLTLENRSRALAEFDEFDEPLLPVPPDTKIRRAYIKNVQIPLQTDAQPIFYEDDFAENYREIVMPKGNEFITWSGNSMDDSHLLALVNDETYRTLSAGDTLWIRGNNKDRIFKAYIGSKEQIEKHVLPESPTLYQNFPNPFNPQTTFKFALTQTSTVRLEVYDILGRKVITLVNGEIQAGFHTAQFNGTSLASGVYLYRLIVNNQMVSVKKMTLLK